MTRPFAKDRISWLGALRSAVMGVAMFEIVFLLGWTGLDLLGTPLRLAPDLHDASLRAVTSLGQGMAWAAVFGALGGTIAAMAFNLGAPAAAVRPGPKRLHTRT